MKRFVPVFVFVAFTLGATMAWGQVPQLISYQGVLGNNAGQLVTDGNYDITFRIFSSVTGGPALHDETHVGVPVANGGFSVLIGSVPGDPLLLQFSVPYWLEIQVAPDASPLSPRIQLASSPYALMAKTVLDGAITSAKITDGSVTSLDILDEPGVAFDQGSISYVVPATGADLVARTVTITTPAAGFILVNYGGYMDIGAHTLGVLGQLRASISETTALGPNSTWSLSTVGREVASGTVYGSTISRSFVYSKPAGTYTFYLVCDSFGGGESVVIRYPSLNAVYLPTAYGTTSGAGLTGLQSSSSDGLAPGGK
ncbi:MAG: hypothetical protein ABIU54_11610 [Candidatus Eisenbacteria bacterium]